MVLFFEDFLRQAKQILVRLNVIDAKPLVRHTILVFHDGKTFRRYDFNGKLPDQAQKVIDLIRLGLKKQTDLKTNIPPG